jgi:hypothetical protein
MIRSSMPPRSAPIKRATTIRASGKRKASRPKMTPARKSAQGQPCMVRLPGCDGGGETTVLAHYRLAGYCGTGIKPPDVMGAWCCASCHDRIDGRVNCGIPRAELRLAHAEGVLRTIAEREA